MNSNFLNGLSISHSSYPSTFRPTPGSLDDEPNSVLGAEAQDNAIAKYGIAGRVWYTPPFALSSTPSADAKRRHREAAYAIMLYVRNPDGYEFDPRFDLAPGATVVELGAGTGAAGLALAAAHPHARVALTDLPEVCPLLQSNAREYPGVEVRPLAWGSAAQARELQDELGLTSISHVICSDLVYFPELAPPLLRTLLHLTAAVPTLPVASPQVVLAYKIRSLSKEMPFWSAFGLWFTFTPVLVRARSKDDDSRWERFDSGGDGEIFLFVARRRAESFSWIVPEDDVALLEGVGARGTDERKADDEFEVLLLMRVDE